MARNWSVNESWLNLLELTDVEGALVRAHEDAMIAVVDAMTVAVDVVPTGMTTEAVMIVVAAVVVEEINVAVEAGHIELNTQFGSTTYHHDAAGPN